MNNKMIVRFFEEDLEYEEKIDMLMEGACKRIFPISVKHNGKLITAYYNTAGYKPLSLLSELTLKSILNVLENVLLAVEECSEYLIFPEEYIMNTNTIYIDDKIDYIKYLYIPDRDKEKFQSKFIRLLNDLKALATENGKVYLDMLIDISSVDKISYRKLRLLISKYSQEVEKYQLI